MNCENAFINTGPYFTCSKCNGPCDTFRYTDYDVDETYYETENNQYKEEDYFGNPWDNAQELPFRRRVPMPEPSKSTALKKRQATDQFRFFGYRIFSLCSKFADPYTWLEMLRESKNKYDIKTKGKRQREWGDDAKSNGESSQKPL